MADSATPAQQVTALLGKMRVNAEQAITQILKLLEAETGMRVGGYDIQRDYSAEGGGKITKVELTVRLP